MSAHTIGTCYEQRVGNFEGQKIVTGEFTGSASYDSGGSVLDLSSQFADEVRGGYITDRSGEFVGQLLPTASTNAAATTKVLVRGTSWDAVTLAYSGVWFDASATTDNANVWLKPANSECVGVRVTLDTAFVAASMTNLTVTIGDAGDTNGLFAGAIDLVDDAITTTDVTWGVEIGDWSNAFATGTAQFLLYATATGADLDALTAGSATAKFYFTPVDSLTGALGKGTMPEVHSGQVLSGNTFTFIAWGTDA